MPETCACGSAPEFGLDLAAYCRDCFSRLIILRKREMQREKAKLIALMHWVDHQFQDRKAVKGLYGH